MMPGIQIALIWWDSSVVQYQVMCSNGCFSGQARIYESYDALSEMATALSGFPSHSKDFRDIELGTFDPKYADGGVRLHFFCIDSVGHIAVNLQLRSGTCPAMGEVESVAMRIPLEAAGVDSFVAQLQIMRIEDGSQAYLPIANSSM